MCPACSQEFSSEIELNQTISLEKRVRSPSPEQAPVQKRQKVDNPVLESLFSKEEAKKEASGVTGASEFMTRCAKMSLQ